MKRLISLLLLASLSLVATAQTSKPPAPKKITAVEGITEYELGNGLRVLLFPDPSQPKITVNITYKVGSRMEGYGETGMAHLLEHLLFKGSKKHPNIPQELTAHGASPNGTTWYDRTNYFETFNASDDNLAWALDLEADRMVNSFIAQKDLQSEFTVVRNEFEMGENSPSSILMERILSSAYLWHNYGKSTIGSKDDIERVPIQNLQAFYKKYYQPDNAVLIVSGRFDEAKTLDLINQKFGVIPRPTRVLQPDYTVEPVQDGERFVMLQRTGDVQTVACAYHIPSGSHPDYAAIDVLNEVLTNEPNGRMYQSLVKSGKAASMWGWAAGLRDPGFMYFSADVLKDRSLDSAKDIMFATLQEMRTKPATLDEINKAKDKLIKDLDQFFRNTESISIALSEFIGQGDWRLLFLYRDNLKKVTVDDVNRVANAYLKPSNRTWGMFIPEANADRAIVPPTPNVDELVKDYKGGQAVAQGEAFDPSPANIDARTQTGTLMGGAKYALLPKSTRGENVEVRITLRLGDEGSLRGKSAVADLTASMLNRGTQTMTRAQIQDALNKLGSTVRVSGGGQLVNISVKTTKANLLPTLDILDDMLHRPAFPQDEFKTLVDENIAAAEQQRADPMALASRTFGTIMSPYPKDDIRYSPTVDEEIAAYRKVNLDDVRQFHKEYYNGSAATIAVVGDFDQAAVKQKLDKMLGNWAAIKSYTRIASPFIDIKPANQELLTPDKKSGMFIAGIPLKIREDNPDYPALMMADFIFGGGFLNSRLATRIRQNEGLSYGVGSFLNASALDEKGMFGAYAIYNPDNKAKLEAAYMQELAKVINEGITQAELDMAKSGLLQERLTDRAEDAGLASDLNQNLFLSRTMAWEQGMDDRLQALSVAQVNAALKKYIDPSKVVVIKAGDFK